MQNPVDQRKDRHESGLRTASSERKKESSSGRDRCIVSLVFINRHTDVVSGIGIPEFLLSSIEGELRENIGLNQGLVVRLEHRPSSLWFNTVEIVSV